MARFFREFFTQGNPHINMRAFQSGKLLCSNPLVRWLEHFQKNCSHSEELKKKSGLFGFWRRFGSVTGFLKPAPSPKPRQNPKILAPNGYSFSSNALGPVNTNT
jgi:hypothetical protein